MSRQLVNIVDLTFTTDTLIYANGDVIADTQVLPLACPGALPWKLESIRLLDEADQKAPLDFIFLDANQSLGAENGAPNISDANAAAVLGRVQVAAADYTDLGGVSVGAKGSIGLWFKPTAKQTSLWVGIIIGTGTPTYAATSLKARFTFTQ
jgi:hypothetical protein